MKFFRKHYWFFSVCVAYSSSFAHGSDFWLVDADSDNLMVNLKNGDVLNSMDIPKQFSLSYIPSNSPSSVKISLNGPAVSTERTERVTPYSLFGDYPSSGDYHGKSSDRILVPGNYTLKANDVSISFTIAEGTSVVTENMNADGGQSDFSLINAATDQAVMQFDEGSVIEMSDIPNSYSLSYAPKNFRGSVDI